MTINLLKTSTLTFTRPDGSPQLLPSGKYSESSTTDFDVKGSLQPYLKGRTTVKLPDGYKTTDARWFYTKTQLNPVDQFSKEDGDQTVIDGHTFVVFDNGDWNQYGLTVDNYACILIRKEIGA